MTSGNICPVCGGGIKEDEGACSVCGTVFVPPEPDQSETAPVETEDTAPESIKCPDCGNMVPAGKNICDECGSRIGMASEDEYEDMEEPDEDEEEVEERIVDVGKEVDELDQGPIEIDEDFDPTNLGKDMEDILKLPGVGPLRAKILMEAGYTDLIKLKRASVMELIKIKGIGRKSAGEIKTALRDMKLQDIRSKELDLESIEKEGACPLCNTIVSVYESACYECGTTLRDHHAQVVEGDQDSMALAYYDTKLKEDPNNKEMWYARGATMIKMEEFDKALSSFDKALEIDPNYQNVWISKAEVFNKMGEPMKAADCYSHVISTTGIETDYEHIDEALEKHDRAMEEKEMGADEQITSMELDEAEEEEIDDEVISFEVEDDVAEEPETETVPEPEPDDEEVEYEEVEVIEYVEVEEDEAA
ncbi:MAG: zinc ribbon domain-containing protein, partial [Thermoplasmata archaeon]|nr:zinc ribbon domain-containing protein [Thermoplasmata archaeon]